MITEDDIAQMLHDLPLTDPGDAWQARVLAAIDAGAQPQNYFADTLVDPDDDAFDAADTIDIVIADVAADQIASARVVYNLTTHGMHAEIGWADGTITKGTADSAYMQTLIARARLEGVTVVNAVIRGDKS